MGRSLSPHGVGCGPFLCEKSGSSGRSGLGGSSLRRCGLAGDLGCGLRRGHLRGSLACGLGGSAVLLSDSGGSGGLGLGRSSLRGGSGGRSRADAGSHADSQDQSSNGNSNILEFHMEDLLMFENSFAEGCTGETFPLKDILVRFRKKSSPFLAKVLFTEEILHFCYNFSIKVKDF